MYINDQREFPTCHFSQLCQGDLFAYEDGDDLFYLMVMTDGDAVVLGVKESETHLTGAVWDFIGNEDVYPLKGELKVWAV